MYTGSIHTQYDREQWVGRGTRGMECGTRGQKSSHITNALNPHQWYEKEQPHAGRGGERRRGEGHVVLASTGMWVRIAQPESGEERDNAEGRKKYHSLKFDLCFH